MLSDVNSKELVSFLVPIRGGGGGGGLKISHPVNFWPKYPVNSKCKNKQSSYSTSRTSDLIIPYDYPIRYMTEEII